MTCLPFSVRPPTELELLRARCAYLQGELALARETIAEQDEKLARLQHWDRQVGAPLGLR
ncbi:MAG: hypothetical protein AB7P08_17120 [Burkholderiales bacterium]